MISPEDREPHLPKAPSTTAARAVDGLLRDAEASAEQFVDWRHQLHRMPELGLNTPQTTEFVRARLEQMGYAPSAGAHGEVTAVIGDAAGPCVLLRADMDGLPVAERSGEPWASVNGCAHACGHDMHATSLLGAARLLRAREGAIRELGGCVKLLFQPGEETLTGAAAVVADGVLESPHVDAAFALHVNGRCPMGLMLYGEEQSAGVWGFRIRLRGHGGHGSMPHKCIDPIIAGVHVHLAIDEAMHREFAAGTEVVLSIGKFEAGSAPNVIPDECVLEGTARAFDAEVMAKVKTRVREVVGGVASTYRVSAEVEDLSDVPPLVVDSMMTDACLAYVGAAEPEMRFRGIQHTLGAEDFAFFSERVPSAYFTVGAAAWDAEEHFSMHDPRIRFDDGALPLCAAAYAAAGLGWLADKAQ